MSDVGFTERLIEKTIDFTREEQATTVGLMGVTIENACPVEQF